MIKWWLLAIPHYLIAALPLAAIWSVWTDDGDGLLYASADGLLGLLVLFTAAALVFISRYPRPLYDAVLGLNRWAFRLIAYSGLMTDSYPPFRLEAGSADAATATGIPTPVTRDSDPATARAA